MRLASFSPLLSSPRLCAASDRRRRRRLVNVAWYLNNLETFAKPQKFDPAGPYVVALPIGAHGMHAIANADVGEVFARVFDARDTYLGRKLAISGTLIASTQQIADAFNEVFAPAKFVANVRPRPPARALVLSPTHLCHVSERL